MKDFITRYQNLLSAITDAPDEFLKAVALCLLSTAVGRKWIFSSIPEKSIFSENSKNTGKLLNLWFILIGKSRVSRKTSGVISPAIDVAKEVFGEERLLSEAFTPEFLISKMAQASTPVDGFLETRCLWISDEISWFFQLLKKRDSYMTSTDAFLSKMYDGKSYSRGTIGRNNEQIQNPYFTCLLCSTTYLPTLFDKLHLMLGFLNRFIFVIGTRGERKRLRTDPLTEDEKSEVKHIVDFLSTLDNRKSQTTIQMNTLAKQVYDSFEEAIEQRIETEDLGVREGYYGNLPNFVVRLACLFRISRLSADEIKSPSNEILTVEKSDVELAINYVWNAWTWFEQVIEIMETKTVSKQKPRDLIKAAIIDLLKNDGKERHFDDIKMLIHQMKIPCSQATLYNSIKDLIETKQIVRSKFGFYKIAVLQDN